MKILVKTFTYPLFAIHVHKMVCLYAERCLLIKTAGDSKYFGIYQVGKGEGKVSVKKGLESTIFEKETLKNVYKIKGKFMYAKELSMARGLWLCCGQKERLKTVQKICLTEVRVIAMDAYGYGLKK